MPEHNDADDATGAKHADDNVAANGIAVLLVEDTRANQIVISRQLNRFCGHVSIAADGKRALALLASRRFDIVLLDCDLPDMSGYDVARRWRAVERTHSLAPIPLIAISASTDIEHVRACFDAQMDGVLNKPVQAAKLRDMLQLWAGKACLEESAAAAQALAPHAIYVELEDDLHRLRVAWLAGDRVQAIHFSHRLTGAFDTWDCAPLAASARQIELALRQSVQASLAFDEPRMQALEAAFAQWKSRA